MSSLDSWKLFFKWFVIFFVILGVQYLALKKFIWNRPRKTRETLYIPPDSSNVVSFWYKKSENCHLIFQPYWPNSHSQQYTDDQLNSILSRNHLTYCKLRITDFQGTVHSFLDARDSVSITLKSGEIINRIRLAESIGKAPQANRLWLNTMCSPGGSVGKKRKGPLFSLGIAAAVNPVIRKRLVMQKYLIAFARPFAFDEIREVRVNWDGKDYLLSSKLCLRRDFDEYLRHPKPSFWKHPGTQASK